MSPQIQELLRTADREANLKPCFLSTAVSDEAKALGLVENYTLELGGITGNWQRLTVAGCAARDELLAGGS